MQENAHDTPAAPGITPPGSSTQPTLTNLKLNHEWTIGEPISKENERHAMVYSVLISESGHSAEELEAHVFVLDDIEPKLRRHRQRCIRRMKRRTKLKLEVQRNTIVVITTSRMENSVLENEAEPHSRNPDGQHETHNGTTSIEKSKQKTLCQLEVRRIRQKERRQAKRHEKTGQGGQTTTDNENDITRNINRDRYIWEDELEGLMDRINKMFDESERRMQEY